MSYYREIIGKIICIICNILILALGGLIVYGVFSQKETVVDLNGLFLYVIAVAFGIVCLGSAIFGFWSAFDEIPWAPLNYVSPVVSIILGLYCIAAALKETTGDFVQILYMTGAAVNFLNLFGVGLIIKSDGREFF